MDKITALYSRVSTDMQREKGLSIPRQKRWLEEEARKSKLKNFRHYVDNGYSATNQERSDYKRLIEDIKEGKVNTVGVYQYNRIARDLKDLLNFVELLKENDVDFVSISENIDTTTPTGKLMFNVYGSLAQWEREMTVERVTEVMDDMAKRGKFCGGQAPLGYNIKNKKLLKNPDEAKTVKKIFNTFEDKKAFRKTASLLNSLGYRTKKRHTFDAKQIKRTLLNPIYEGYQTWGKKRHGATKVSSKENWIIAKTDVEPIISRKQFERVGRIIRQRDFTPPKRSKRIYLLSTLIYCGNCGAKMVGNHFKANRSNKKSYSYYACRDNTNKGTCNMKRKNKEKVDKLVLDTIKKEAKLRFAEMEAKEVDKKNNGNNKGIEQIEQIDKQIKNIEDKKERLLTLFVNAEFDKDKLKKHNSKLDKEQDQLLSQKDKLLQKANSKNKKGTVVTLAQVNKLNGNIYSLPEETKQKIIRELIRKVTINKEGKIGIEMYEL